MRLSDAAVLGSCTDEMTPHCWSNCFLGAAANAIGLPPVKQTEVINGVVEFDATERIEAILAHWPWLASNENERMLEIAALFDSEKMSFGELVQYVRLIEPDCECGVRDCCCARIAALKDDSSVSSKVLAH